MLRDDHELVSVDDHLIEHPRVWQDRLPRKWSDAGPHVVEVTESSRLEYFNFAVDVPAGAQMWVYEGRITPNVGSAASAGATTYDDKAYDAVRFEDMRPGAYDPVARLADMDIEGVAAQLPFPTFPGFAGGCFFDGDDKELSLLCVRAYNDFVLEEWCAAAPDRYIPLIILPLWDVGLCVNEIRRGATRGARAISFPDNPAGPMALPSFFTGHWDPVFSAAEDAELPLCMHFGGSRITPTVSRDATIPVTSALFGMTLYNSLAELVFAGTFDRHPRLQVVYSEGGIGWIPFALQRMDQVWSLYRTARWITPPLDPTVPPSQVIKEHIWGCFINDPLGVELRDRIGVDRLLWECDYPHPDCLFPESRTVARGVFADVPDDDVVKITSSNARRLFRFPAA